MKLRDLADIRMGYPFRARIEPEHGGSTVVIQMKDIGDDNRIRFQTAFRVDIPSTANGHLLEPGDVLCRSRGQSYGAALVPESIPRAIAAAPLLRIRARDVSPDYLLWYLNRESTQAHLRQMARGTSTQMVGKESLAELDVPVPGTNQQHAIVRIAALAAEEERLLMYIADRRRALIDMKLMSAATNPQRTLEIGGVEGAPTPPTPISQA